VECTIRYSYPLWALGSEVLQPSGDAKAFVSLLNNPSIMRHRQPYLAGLLRRIDRLQ